MTGEYKDALALRILKFTPIRKIILGRITKLISICLLGLFCGYMLHFLFGNESIYPVILTHFGAFFKDKSFLQCVFAIARYALFDMLFISFIAFFGYTMLSSPLCKAAITIYSAILGWCGAFVFDLLIKDNLMSGGSGAFALFAMSKLAILTALIFCTMQSEDFSYRFSDIFRIERHPFFHRESKIFILTMISTAGFSAIIHTLYLIFMSIQKCSLL
ncbi:MAG: hypothetical protein IKJ91_10305 [Clostridia bacterium]|nr:hypothetical protein [Clostridia bacterium]